MSIDTQTCRADIADMRGHAGTSPDGPGHRKTRGGRFFVLGRELWARLHAAPTVNRLNLYTAALVLLAGTGADGRTTKWSAKACETHAGMGKPRARRAIEELVGCGLAERVADADPTRPQYRLPDTKREADPIFLPVALVTGLAGETSVLRRVRETGDPGLLRMLVDLHGLVEPDAAGGVPIDHLNFGSEGERPTVRLAERGAHAVWAPALSGIWKAAGGWTAPHRQESAPAHGWAPFWDRLDTLRRVGALASEPWVFDGPRLDAEPLFPAWPTEDGRDDCAAVQALLTLHDDLAHALLHGHPHLLKAAPEHSLLLPHPLHRQPPTIRHVFRPRVEADTPAARLSWARRRELIETRTAACARVLEAVQAGRSGGARGGAA